MGHLKGIGLENFRVFDKMTYMNFAPLTILTGANNSGKSSILKALMLVTDNFKTQTHVLQVLNFSGKEHNLSDAESTRNKYSKNSIIKIVLPYKSFFLEKMVYFEMVHNTSSQHQVINKSNKILIGNRCLSEMRKDKKTNKEFLFFDFKLFFENLKPFNNNEISDELIENGGVDKEIYTLFDLKNEILYNSNAFNDAQVQLKASSEFFFTTTLFFNYYNDNFTLTHHIPNIISLLEDSLKKEFNSYQTWYTHPEKQKRSYDINDKDSINRIINKIFDIKPDFEIMGKHINFNFIDKWSKVFGLDKVRPKQNKTLKRNYIEINSTDNIINYGLGTTQIVNILLAIQAASYGRFPYSAKPIVLIEEPESNLHPNYQSKLADLLVDATNNFNIQFIVETHSEYLIRKLQYLTAKNVIKPEDTIIHYFTDPKQLAKGEKQIKEIRIKKNGVLTQDFGTGFFDEADNLAIDLFQISDSAQN